VHGIIFIIIMGAWEWVRTGWAQHAVLLQVVSSMPIMPSMLMCACDFGAAAAAAAAAAVGRVVFEECCDLITGFREEPYMKDLWREAHAARDKDAPMMAFTGSLVTARSITMNYEAPPHLDEGDLDTGFILWYKVEPESTPNKKSSSRSSRSSGSSAGDAFCNPQTVFRLSCDVPADGSVEGGLQFAPCSQGVLMLDTTCVVHNAMCDVPQAKTRAQELQRGGMMGSALFFCRGTQSKVNRIFADVRRQQAAAKPSVQCRKGQEPK